jgi:Asp-tRNA(Asn)/Glu-tRNA(Gln) amidotransferase A subunit family amidase
MKFVKSLLSIHISPWTFQLTLRSTDDPEIYDGGPAAIQIFAKNLEEEKLLSIAQIVVDALKKQASESKR